VTNRKDRWCAASESGSAVGAAFLGFHVPADESLPATAVRAAHSCDWHRILQESLTEGKDSPGSGALHLARHMCSFGIAYYRAVPNSDAPPHHRHQHSHHHSHSHSHGGHHRREHHHHDGRRVHAGDAAGGAEGVNARVAALLDMFPGLGTKTEPPSGRLTASLKYRVAVTGDAIVLLRQGDAHFAALEEALRLMQEQYEPMRQLRLQKEGRERQWRLDQHQHYRQLVCGLALPLMRAIEGLYKVLRSALPAGTPSAFPSPVPSVAQLPAHHTRLIVTRFDDQLEAAHKPATAIFDYARPNWWQQLGCVGLLDVAVVGTNESLLECFDERCPAALDYGAFDRRDQRLRTILTESGDPTSAGSYLADGPTGSGREPAASAGQLVYCAYQLHCYNCRLPMHTCSFPGCGYIRGQAAAHHRQKAVSAAAEAERYLGREVAAEGADLTAMRGSGVHPVDSAIRDYFTRHRRVFQSVPPLRLTDPEGDVTVAEEVHAEAVLDLAVRARHDTLLKLELRWRALQEQAAFFCALHCALVRPELAVSLTARELLMARGGVHALAELTCVRKIVTRTLVTHSAAANADFASYDEAAAKEVVRLVPSATMLLEQEEHRLALLEEERAVQGEAVTEGSDGEDAESSGSSDDASGSGSSGTDDNSGSSCSGSGSSRSRSDSDSYSASTEGSSVAAGEQLLIAAPVHTKQTHSIPIALLRALSASPAAKVMAFDPYPALQLSKKLLGESDPRAGNAMPAAMYTLLMQRLRLTRADRLPAQPKVVRPSTARPASALARPDTRATTAAAGEGPVQAPDHYFRFDRLHHEQAAVLQDGSAVLVQCLHGVLQGASLVVVQPPPTRRRRGRMFLSNDVFPNIELVENASGAPPAAVRFLDTAKLGTLNPGMTVVVFDQLSTVSRAFIIEERSLKRTCEAFRVAAEDYGGLAHAICMLASRCIQLTRAGRYCTSVMFSVASLFDTAEDPHQEQSHAQEGRGRADPAYEVGPSPLTVRLSEPNVDDRGAEGWGGAVAPSSGSRVSVRYSAPLSRFSAIHQLLSGDST
jgi:hypothetical protein